METYPITFLAPSSFIDFSFWEELYQRKLNILQLQVEEQQISCSFSYSNGQRKQAYYFHQSSFGETYFLNNDDCCHCNGILLNVNTLTDFKELDKKELLQKVASQIWESIITRTALQNPLQLYSFLMITFGDLKAYKFTFWCAYPVLLPPSPFVLMQPISLLKQNHTTTVPTTPVIRVIHTAIANHLHQKKNIPIFAVIHHRNASEDTSTSSSDSSSTGSLWSVHPLHEVWPPSTSVYPIISTTTTTTTTNGSTGITPTYTTISNMMIIILDTGCDDHPGWAMRNLLTLLTMTSDDSVTFQSSASSSTPPPPTQLVVDIVAFRATVPFNTLATTDVSGWTDETLLTRDMSLLFQVILPSKSVFMNNDTNISSTTTTTSNPIMNANTAVTAVTTTTTSSISNILTSESQWTSNSSPLATLPLPPPHTIPSPTVSIPSVLSSYHHHPLPRVVGWETNEQGKPGPRVADLGSVLDSKKLMEQAVDLNLRLMKWRMWPELNTEKLATTKCLLLGAGTLGCAVARTLLGWGVCDITFVDNGKVSYSNPIRQCLFEFSDCESKKYKAIAAAERLQAIFPGVQSKGYVLTIPMPGRIDEESQEAMNTIDTLIQSHDIIFALTDTREARWLPTVSCAAYNKCLINAALGFDSYLVMRHGGSPEAVDRLGCYFCTDIIAPGGSTKERTLDQQCTVTRPGLAYIAAALAVELMVAILHHPLEHLAPSALTDTTKIATLSRKNVTEKKEEKKDNDTTNDNINRLEDKDITKESEEVLPHQLRGSVYTFQQTSHTFLNFKYCTGCSKPLVDAYRLNRHDLLTLASSTTALESLSGVTSLTEGLDDMTMDGYEDDTDDW